MRPVQFTTAPAPTIIPLSSHDLRQIALYDLLHFAIANEQPLVILYATKGKEEKARVVVPYDLYDVATGADIIKAHDSVRNAIISLRVDWIKSAHHLTTV